MPKALIRIGRLALVAGLFAAAAFAMPSRGLLQASGSANSSDTNSALVGAFRGPDRQLVARGRAASMVGKKAPTLDLKSFSGTNLPLDNSGRAAILLFVAPGCADCATETQKLAALSVVYFEDIYTVVVAPSGKRNEVKAMVDRSSGGGLVLGGEDISDRLASALKIKTRPATVIVGSDGTIGAIWSEPVPLSVFYAFLKTAYGLKRG